MTDLGPDLYRSIVEAYHAVPPAERWLSHWVMSDEWLQETRKITDTHGYPLWQASDLLFGLPCVITEDGGLPHLEPDAVPRMSRMVTMDMDGGSDHGDGQ